MVSIATRYMILRNKGRPTKSNIAKSEQSSHTPGDHATLIGKKENGQIKVLLSIMWLNFLYTVQLVISDVCTKFQNSRSSRS